MGSACSKAKDDSSSDPIKKRRANVEDGKIEKQTEVRLQQVKEVETKAPELNFSEAIQDGDAKRVKELLKDESPDDLLEHPKWGDVTPLVLAASSGQEEVVSLLLEADANVDTQCGSDNSTALICAAREGNVECLRLILQTRPSVNTEMNSGDTALHLAALKGNTTCVMELLKAGASVHMKNENQQSALHAACKGGFLGAVIAIKNAGADVYAEDKDGLIPGRIAQQNGHHACSSLLRSA